MPKIQTVFVFPKKGILHPEFNIPPEKINCILTASALLIKLFKIPNKLLMSEDYKIDISIVIPCYNDGRFIEDAIASVEAYKGSYVYEIIVVDDGSIETQTQAVLAKLQSKGYLIVRQPNQGLGNARNNGIRHAKGRFILPLDSDNKIRSNYIEKGVSVLAANLSVDIAYGNPQFFGEAEGIQEVPSFELECLLLGNTIDACAVYRKSLWEQIGGYDEKMPIMGYEDWDFWLSAAKIGAVFHHLHEVTFDYRVRSDSMLSETNQMSNQRQLIRYIYKKHVDLYNAGDASHVLFELTLSRLQAEKSRRRVYAVQAEMKRKLSDNKFLLKTMIKNIKKPFLRMKNYFRVYWVS